MGNQGHCLVRLAKKDGLCCHLPCVSGGQMCTKHMTDHSRNNIARLTVSLGNRHPSTSLTYEAFRSVKEVNAGGRDTIECLSGIISYVFSSPSLTQFMQDNLPQKRVGGRATRMKVPDMAHAIAKLFNGMWTIEQSHNHLRALQKCQLRWKGYVRKKQEIDRGPWHAAPAINTEDPITMDPIPLVTTATEAMKREMWSYTDKHRHVYVFQAKPLLHFIEVSGSWNPYTREPIMKEDIERLRNIVKRLPFESFKPIIRNPRDAFANVLHDYEVFGFYTCIEWFLRLDTFDVIEIYEKMREDTHVPLYMFALNVLEERIMCDPEEGARMSLAKDMKYLIDGHHPMKFYIICNLFVALAKVCPILRSSLPQWTIMGANGVR